MHVIIYVSTVHRILSYLFTFTTRIIRSIANKKLKTPKSHTRTMIVIKLLLLNFYNPHN